MQQANYVSPIWLNKQLHVSHNGLIKNLQPITSSIEAILLQNKAHCIHGL
jgi:hypothetical protein